MSGKKNAPKGSKKSPKPEAYYQFAFHAYYLQAFNALDKELIKELIPADADLLPAGLFIEKAQGQSIYTDPTPRAAKFITYFIVHVHNRVVEAIERDDPTFINMLCSIPETRVEAIKKVTDPGNVIHATFSSLAFKKKNATAALASKGMQRFLKGLVEVILGCSVVYKHLPGTKTYLPFLCQAANFPVELIQLAKHLPPQETRKKGKAAAEAPADEAPAATASTSAAPDVADAEDAEDAGAEDDADAAEEESVDDVA